MLQCQCVKIPVVEGREERVQAWIAGLADRSSEVLEALKVEGIRDEAVFFSREPSGGFLYLYSRAGDLAAAARAFQESTLTVDLEFKRILADCLDLSAAVPLQLLFAADGGQSWVVSRSP